MHGAHLYQDLPAFDASKGYWLCYWVHPDRGAQSVEIQSGRSTDALEGYLDTRVTIQPDASTANAAKLALDYWGYVTPNFPTQVTGSSLANIYGSYHLIEVVANTTTRVQSLYVDEKLYAVSSAGPLAGALPPAGQQTTISFGQFAGFSTDEDDFFYDDFFLSP